MSSGTKPTIAPPTMKGVSVGGWSVTIIISFKMTWIALARYIVNLQSSLRARGSRNVRLEILQAERSSIMDMAAPKTMISIVKR